MGETLPVFSTTFNRSAQIEARADHLSADTGALLLREIMERTGIIEWMTERLVDPRNPHLITYPLADLLRTSLLMLGQGWRDQDDADRLRHDPSLRVANDSRRGTASLEQDSVLPSQPTLSRLLDVLRAQANQEVLREAVIEQALRRLELSNHGRRYKRLMVDVDGLPAQVHGQQSGSEYNGYYGQRMFHALIASCAESGEMLGGTLRPGAVGSADGALEFIRSVVERVRRVCESVLVRLDPGFPDGQTLTGLESAGIDYVARLRNNAVLDRMAEPYLRRPPGRPPREGRAWCRELRYQADSWEHPRRVVLVVVERPGELFLDYFWLITNLKRNRYSGARLLGLPSHSSPRDAVQSIALHGGPHLRRRNGVSELARCALHTPAEPRLRSYRRDRLGQTIAAPGLAMRCHTTQKPKMFGSLTTSLGVLPRPVGTTERIDTVRRSLLGLASDRRTRTASLRQPILPRCGRWAIPLRTRHNRPTVAHGDESRAVRRYCDEDSRSAAINSRPSNPIPAV